MCPDMQLDRRKTHVEKSLWLSSNFTWTHDIRVQEHSCTLVTLYGIPQPYKIKVTSQLLIAVVHATTLLLRIVITPKHICGISTGLMKSSYQFASRPLNSFTLWISVS